MISFEVIVHFSVPVLFIMTIHRHNQNLVGTLHKGVPTVVYRHENCCKIGDLIPDFFSLVVVMSRG